MSRLSLAATVAVLATVIPTAPATGQDAATAALLGRTASDPGPGAEEHGLLAALAGDYELTSRYWPDPEGDPVVSRLPARRRLVLDGRVLQLEVGPDARGFRGKGLMGYDESEGRFWYVWTDTSRTGVAVLTGVLAADGSGGFAGQQPTPAGMAPLRVTIRRDAGSEVHDYRVPADAGGEARFLELRYVRRR